MRWSSKFQATPGASKVMAGVKSKETTPEILLRKTLWQLGVRGYRKNASLPGKPDLLFSRRKLIVFVDGCIWHGCPEHGRIFKSNSEYWQAKIARNKDRDARTNRMLQDQGYEVVRVWEHDIMQTPAQVADSIRSLLTGTGGLPAGD